MKSSDDRLPMTVFPGFLGSGKTTLMNHLLAAMDRKRAGDWSLHLPIRELPAGCCDDE